MRLLRFCLLADNMIDRIDDYHRAIFVIDVPAFGNSICYIGNIQFRRLSGDGGLSSLSGGSST